jgi:hypothetical protein
VQIYKNTKNANNLLALDAMDFGISPTRWQASTIPETYQKKINVIFDGINTELVKPDPEASLKIKVSKDEELY